MTTLTAGCHRVRGPAASSLGSCLVGGACPRESSAVDAEKGRRAVPLEAVAVDAVGAADQGDFEANVP